MELDQIISGGQSTNRFFRGKRYGRYKHVRDIMNYFIQVGSIINGNRG